MVGASKLIDSIACGGAGTDGCEVFEDAGLIRTAEVKVV